MGPGGKTANTCKLIAFSLHSEKSGIAGAIQLGARLISLVCAPPIVPDHKNGPFSRHFGIFHGPKCVTMGSKWAKNTCVSIPNGPGSLLEKCVINQFLTHFWSQNSPFSWHFGIFHGPKRITMGSKRAKNTWLNTPNGLGSLLEKCILDPFLTHFWYRNRPFSRHFGIFHGPKRTTMGSKRAKNTFLSIPSGAGTTLETIFFSPRGPWWTHHWPPPCAARATVWLHIVTTGIGV